MKFNPPTPTSGDYGFPHLDLVHFRGATVKLTPVEQPGDRYENSITLPFRPNNATTVSLADHEAPEKKSLY